MKLRKIIALFIALVTLITCLTSCGKSFEERMEKAEEDFRSNPYRVGVSIDLSCSDSELAGVFEELENNTAAVYFAGGSFKSTSNTKITVEGVGVYDFNTSCVAKDGILCVNHSYTEPDGTAVMGGKNWVKITSDEQRTVARKLCLVGGITADDFGAVAVSKVKKKKVLATYTEPTVNVRIVLEKMIIDLLEFQCDKVSVKDASLTVELYKDRYKSATVECEYDITVSGITCTLRAAVRLDFSTDGEFDISYPSDAENYKEAELGEIIDLL